MFHNVTAAWSPVSGRPSPATGTLPFGIDIPPAIFAQYAAALQAQQVRQAAALSAPEPSRVHVVQPLQTLLVQFVNGAVGRYAKAPVLGLASI